jgi:hypothetical protein
VSLIIPRVSTCSFSARKCSSSALKYSCSHSSLLESRSLGPRQTQNSESRPLCIRCSQTVINWKRGSLCTLCKDNGLASGLTVLCTTPPGSIGNRPSIVLCVCQLEAVFLEPWFACLQSADREQCARAEKSITCLPSCYVKEGKTSGFPYIAHDNHC